jgi:hypothetical protein
VTDAPSATVRAGPASAVGASLSAVTVITTVSVSAVVPSVTETWNVDEYSARPSIAVKVGAATLVADSVCVAPVSNDHV